MGVNGRTWYEKVRVDGRMREYVNEKKKKKTLKWVILRYS